MTTRDAILDGALRVMQTRGLARTTTKEIALAAGFSEATLYKLFHDKFDLFLSVVAERLPRVGVVGDAGGGLAGRGTVGENLRTIALEIERFYEASLPIAMSLFSDVALLNRHRAAVHARGGRPEVIVEGVAAYLGAEQARGRVGENAPLVGAAGALVGACMHRAFLRCFNDETGPALGEDPVMAAFADDLVSAILPSLDG